MYKPFLQYHKYTANTDANIMSLNGENESILRLEMSGQFFKYCLQYCI